MRFDGASAYPNLPPRRPAFKLKMHGFGLRSGSKILNYYQSRSSFYAQHLKTNFEVELRRIEANPHSYPKHIVDNLRKCVLKSHIIFFTIRSPFVAILCVRDSRRRPPDKLLVKLANAKRLTVWPYMPNFRKDQFVRPEKI